MSSFAHTDKCQYKNCKKAAKHRVYNINPTSWFMIKLDMDFFVCNHHHRQNEIQLNERCDDHKRVMKCLLTKTFKTINEKVYKYLQVGQGRNAIDCFKRFDSQYEPTDWHIQPYLFAEIDKFIMRYVRLLVFQKDSDEIKLENYKNIHFMNRFPVHWKKRIPKKWAATFEDIRKRDGPRKIYYGIQLNFLTRREIATNMALSSYRASMRGELVSFTEYRV